MILQNGPFYKIRFYRTGRSGKCDFLERLGLEKNFPVRAVGTGLIRELRTFSSPVGRPEIPFQTPAICGNCTRRADGVSRASHPVQSPTHSHLPIVVASESDSPSSSSSSLSSSSSSSLFRFLAPFSPSFFSLAPLFFSFASLVPFLPSFFSLASLASLLVLLLLLSLASFFRWPPSFPWPSSFPWPPSSPWPPSWSFSSLGAPGSS